MESLTSTDKLRPNPRNRSSFLGLISYLSFSWVLPLLLEGRKKQLDIDDLYQPLGEHNSDDLGNRMQNAWNREIQSKNGTKTKPSLMKAGLSIFGWPIMLRGTLLLIFELAFRVTVPLMLGQIIKYYADPGNNDRSEAYMYAVGIIVCNFFSVLSNHLIMLSNLSLGLEMRIAACSLIYRKALKLGKNALIKTSSGQIVNLLSNDVSRSVKLFYHFSSSKQLN